MHYFAYGSNLSAKLVQSWARQHNLRPPAYRNGRAALLENHRLCFPIFSEYWGGGVADVAYDPGKTVMGAVFDVVERDLETLDQKVNRRVDAAGQEVGAHRRQDVQVRLAGGGPLVKAIAHVGVSGDRLDVPPTRYYMDAVIEGAYENGLTMMWIEQLRSFATQPGKPPKPVGR